LDTLRLDKGYFKNNLKNVPLHQYTLIFSEQQSVNKNKKGRGTLLPFEVMVAIREGHVFYILTAAA
jgi:hypothetical protein